MSRKYLHDQRFLARYPLPRMEAMSEDEILRLAAEAEGEPFSHPVFCGCALCSIPAPSGPGSVAAYTETDPPDVYGERLNVQPEDRIAHLSHIAERMHEGQVDKSGAPYIEHVFAVRDGVPVEAKAVALFHDVVEDGVAGFEDLVMHLTPAEFGAVRLLTRDKAVGTYADYIAAIDGDPSGLARIVKVADLRHNLGRLTPELEGLRSRYEAALRVLDPPAEPAPLGTGRWEYDGVHSWTINGPGSRGVTLHPNGEIWNNIDGPPELTADDYEAAARIIRSGPPSSPVPLDAGRWVRDDGDADEGWRLPGDEGSDNGLSLLRREQYEAPAAWTLETGLDDQPVKLTADDLGASARIIRHHQKGGS